MNKRALKEFAVYARNELRRQIGLRAQTFGITPEGSPQLTIGNDYVELNGKKYDKSQKSALEKLINELNQKGYDQLLEEVAYTWFNRLIAIRYMEVHRYLPSRIRVLSSETIGKVDPDLLTEYRYANLKIDEQEIADLLQEGKRDEAYRKLLVAQCNELNEIMPFLFEKITDYTELLLPDNLLHADSMINRLVNDLEEESFEHVEVIGWLYQYYISEKKDEVFAELKKNKKITKENIPAATQLFTPHWIVRYMVENSLGHMWLESYPKSNLKEQMRYYVEPAEQEPEVQAKMDELKNPHLNPEEITIIDPACGSGHILVYAFDLLYSIYEEQGYPAKDIPTLILENNLYGIDIDDRAAQLASFALMMKAREKTKRVFRNPPKLNVISIQESNGLDVEGIIKLLAEDDIEKIGELKGLLDTFKDAKNYGSILLPKKIDYKFFMEKIDELEEKGTKSLFEIDVIEQLPIVKILLVQSILLTNNYDVVITNPPYMGRKGMNNQLVNYVDQHYPETKSDLFAIFMQRMEELTLDNKYFVPVTMQSWMFLSSYEKYRQYLIRKNSIQNMVHMANMVMGIAFGTVASIFRKNIKDIKGVFQYISLGDLDNGIPKEFPIKNKRFSILNANKFSEISGSPIAYWASLKVRNIFQKGTPLNNISSPKTGMTTSDNNRFLRLWFEVNKNKMGLGFKSANDAKKSKLKWFPYNKGGGFRKWRGFDEYVINWENDGYEIKNNKNSSGKKLASVRSEDKYFQPAITWSAVTSSGKFSSRVVNFGYLFDSGGSSIFPEEQDIHYIQALLSTPLTELFVSLMNPTLNFQPGDLGRIPVIYPDSKDDINKVNQLVISSISISKFDWDSFEISWGFEKHPLIKFKKNSNKIEKAFKNWDGFTGEQFSQLKKNEEEINRKFIHLYDLQDELTPEVLDNYIAIRRADRERDARSFLSYAIGLMMGRYSVDEDGLAYAGGEWDGAKYQSFLPDKDGIIPLTEETYFEDDVMSRLEEILTVIYGEETLQENLYWLADSLKMKANETPTERLRRYFFDEFYSDHCRIYQKRPIYWLAESGKKKGFRALFYLHRYTPETLATMRLNYVQNLQEKLRQEEKRIETVLTNPDLSTTEKRKLDKQLSTIRGQQEELVEFDKVLAEYANKRIDLDLDDGVVENYKQLSGILAKIK